MDDKKQSVKTKDAEKIIKTYEEDKANVEPLYSSFDQKEKIVLGVPYDAVSVYETKSKVVDPTLLTSVIRQNNSVMAQLPTGKVYALSSQNKGKSIVMDILLHKQVLPHANSQFDVYTKLWLLSFYRKVYGSFGVLVDYVENRDYVGPDFTLIPVRNIVPQSGKTTIEDSDYVFVSSWVTKEWLEKRDKKTWKNLDDIIKTSGDAKIDATYAQRKESKTLIKHQYHLVTKYIRDRWITFHPATRAIVRDIENPQKNNQLSVIMCHSYPLLDRFFGLGEFERGETLHLAAGSLINLYLEGVKLGIFPRWKIDPQYIDNWNDLEDGMGPGQIILMKRGFFDGVEQMQGNTKGLETFQPTYNFLKAAIMTVTNTSDTSISANQDIGMGKTPQALRMQQALMGAQTNFDRRMLELSIEKIFDRMIDLIAKRQKDPMKVYLKAQDIKKIEEIYPDVVEMFEYGDMGKVTITPQHFDNTEYRYEIDQGTTMKKDEVMENMALEEVLAFLIKLPNIQQAIAENNGLVPMGKHTIDISELIKRWIITKGVGDWEKIVVERNDTGGDVMGENALNVDNPQVEQAVEQSAGTPITDPMIAQAFEMIKNAGMTK